MKQVTLKSLPNVKEYLKRDIPNCIYLYIDICKYGLSDPHVKFWIDEDESGINLVIMQYHNSLQLFSMSDNWDVYYIAKLIKENNYSVINAKVSMIARLLLLCPGYTLHHGAVFSCTNYRKWPDEILIEKPSIQDYPEIASLICSDPVFSHYDKQDLEYQLIERALSNMGRSLIVRENGKIIAHIATFAEYDKIAVTSGLIVEKSYRDYPYGALLESALFEELLHEGFNVYTFVTEPSRKLWLKALKCKQVADYGKMVPIQ